MCCTQVGSILINLLIWDQHASPLQLCFLALGLAGGSLFQQAPLRQKPGAKSPVASREVAPDVTLQEKLPLVQHRETRLSGDSKKVVPNDSQV